MYFETNEEIVKSLLDANLSKLKDPLEMDDKRKIYSEVLTTTENILIHIYRQPQIWDKYTPKNIKAHGEAFLQNIKDLTKFIIKLDEFDPLNTNTNNLSFDDSTLGLIRDTYLNSLRFLYEMDFRYKEGIDDDLNSEVKKSTINHMISDNFNEEFRSEILYIVHFTPLLITKDLFHSDEIKLFSDFEESKLSAENTLDNTETLNAATEKRLSDFKNELDEKEKVVHRLKETLDKQETAFNFVGLYDGFKQLLRIKIKESRVLLGLLVAMGCMMIIPLLCTIFDWLPESTLKAEEPVSHLFKLIPFISLEVLLIYFFRVILQNYKSVKGQILQIELRQTLCQFIQSYADYSKKIRTNDSHPLEKFENLIFSGIISDAENLPSTFDGMDQIGKLFSTLKAKG